MKEQDLDQILMLEAKSFPTPWTRRMFLFELFAPHSFSLVAGAGSHTNGDVVGYAIFRVVYGEVHIFNLATHPAFRRRGVAQSLLHHVIDLAYTRGGIIFFLEVRAGNEAAVNLYKKMGFSLCSVRRRYYVDTGEDALIMRLFYGGRVYERCVNE